MLRNNKEEGRMETIKDWVQCKEYNAFIGYTIDIDMCVFLLQ